MMDCSALLIDKQNCPMMIGIATKGVSMAQVRKPVADIEISVSSLVNADTR